MTAPAQELEPGWALVHLVCTGPVTLQGGKQGMGFATLDPTKPGHVGDAVYFTRKGLTTSPGEVWSLPAKEAEGLYRVSKKRFVRVYGGEPGEDKDNLAFWRLKADAAVAVEREAAMAKAGKTKALREAMEAMEPLRVAYRSTDRWGRTVMEALVLQYLRGGS